MTTEPLAFQLFNEIGILEQLSGALFDGVLPKGMTRAQFSILNHFVRLEPGTKSPAALASAFQVTRPTMTSTLSRMERGGLICIDPDPNDGRAKLVSITAAGREMRELCIAALAPLIPQMETIASDSEIEALLPALRRIRMAMDEARN
jgi:DNA-binding MarR family transcriptional regulator